MRARAPSGIALPMLLVMAAGCASPTWTPVPISTLPAAPPAEPASRPPPRGAPKPQAPTAPTAIDGALPAGLDVSLPVHETCTRACSPAAGRAYPEGVARGSAAPAGVWSQVLARGVTLTIPRDAQVDLLGVVVRGEATVRALEAREELPLPAWSALRAAGGGVVLTARQPDTLLVLAVVTDGKALSELGAPAAWKARPAPLETRDLAKSDDLAWAGGAMHARLGFEKGRASLGLLLASRDAGVARHRHDDAWEVLVALRADGAFELSSEPSSPAGLGGAAPRPEAREASQHLVGGMVAAVPRGAPHAWKPAGTDPLVAVQLYVPPGPEQRFRALAKKP